MDDAINLKVGLGVTNVGVFPKKFVSRDPGARGTLRNTLPSATYLNKPVNYPRGLNEIQEREISLVLFRDSLLYIYIYYIL